MLGGALECVPLRMLLRPLADSALVTLVHRFLLQYLRSEWYVRLVFLGMHRLELSKGVDLSHVICSPTAASAIKSYSPDLIVHPILSQDLCVSPLIDTMDSKHIQTVYYRAASTVHDEISGLLSRLHVLVIGPGLGRESYMQNYARDALNIAKSRGMFVVLDADGLFMVGQDLTLIKGYRRAVLTPNVVEFKRLSEQVVRNLASLHDLTGTKGRGRVSIPKHQLKTLRGPFRVRSEASLSCRKACRT